MTMRGARRERRISRGVSAYALVVDGQGSERETLSRLGGAAGWGEPEDCDREGLAGGQELDDPAEGGLRRCGGSSFRSSACLSPRCGHLQGAFAPAARGTRSRASRRVHARPAAGASGGAVD